MGVTLPGMRPARHLDRRHGAGDGLAVLRSRDSFIAALQRDGNHSEAIQGSV